MRFISRFGRYGVSIRPEIVEAYANGGRKVTQAPITAIFEPYKLTVEERLLATTSWTFNGFYQEQDEVSIVQPDYRIGAFDSREAQLTHGWSDEERKEVERILTDLAERFPNDMLVIADRVLVAPWPNYDIFDGTILDLTTKILADGYSLADVLAYESDNQARLDVIAALEQLIEDDLAPLPRSQPVEEVLG